MTSRATSANATTSARRITGGSSFLLSGNGVLTASLAGARSLGRVRNRLSPGSRLNWMLSLRRRVANRLRLPNPPPPPKFHRGIVSGGLLDSIGHLSIRTEPGSPGRVCCEKHHLMRIAMGQIMTKTFAGNRRPSPRVTNALIFAGALLLAPAILSSAASAQVLGYASTSQPGFPSDNMITAPIQPSLSDEGDGSVVPERLRRTVVSFETREAPGTVIVDTANTALYFVLGQGR